METKVDSLNIVSNTKPLPVVSRPEINGNIEVFKNDTPKHNVDEINLSNYNNIQTEEKSDNINGWLIGIGIAFGAIATGSFGINLIKRNPKLLVKIVNKSLIKNTDKTLKNSIPDLANYISKDFDTIKSQLLSSSLDEVFLNQIRKAKTPKEIAQIAVKIQTKELAKVMNINETLITSTMSGVEKQTLISTSRKEYSSKIYILQKSLSLKSTNPRVVEIETILRQKYGLEFVSLKDDIIHAEKVLKACEIMRKNGDKIPKNYIVSHMQVGIGQCLASESAVLHSSTNLERVLQKKLPVEHFSTNSEYHTIIHEFGHSLQPEIIDTIIIPEHLRDVAATVSGYANCGSTAELFAELFAKIRLTPEKVTKKEMELFNHIKKLSKTLE